MSWGGDGRGRGGGGGEGVKVERGRGGERVEVEEGRIPRLSLPTTTRNIASSLVTHLVHDVDGVQPPPLADLIIVHIVACAK